MNARVPPALYRFSPRFFVVFLALTVWAFWPSYFARLFEQPSLLHHAHGIVLALWLVMLVVQAQLIRTQRRPLHRQLGKLSYVVGAGRRRSSRRCSCISALRRSRRTCPCCRRRRCIRWR